MIFVHGSKLIRKAEGDPALSSALNAYREWNSASLAIKGRSQADVAALTKLVDDYKLLVEEPIFDKRDNSAQEVLQSSILEEFFQYIFANIEQDAVKGLLNGPASGFIDLVFNPRDVKGLVSSPDITIRRKDHDFVIGASIELSIKAAGSPSSRSENIIVPAIAIECKRYLERNMLDECSGTAEKVKRATPYCLYYVVAEFLKMDNASPEVSLIDEIYILRKQKNSECQGTAKTSHVGSPQNQPL